MWAWFGPAVINIVTLIRVLKLQKRAARVILDANRQANSVKLFNKLNWIPFSEQAKLSAVLYTSVYRGMYPPIWKAYLSLLARFIHVRLDMPTLILFAQLSNDKLKEEEHLPWLPVKPGTAYRYLCENYPRLNLLGTLFGREFLKNSSF